MIRPAPTTPIDPRLARGVLLEQVSETATRPGYIRFALPGTDYVLHLLPAGPIATPPGQRLVGTIRAQARRVDIVGTGGCYVEPVEGRPRRVQGRVIAASDEDGTITVDAGVPITCRLTDQRQQPSQFPLGALVSFDVLPGATFTPERPHQHQAAQG